MPKPTRKYTIRIPVAIADALEAEARDTRRTLTATLELALELYLRARLEATNA